VSRERVNAFADAFLVIGAGFADVDSYGRCCELLLDEIARGFFCVLVGLAPVV
jgi:hypothetical protein